MASIICFQPLSYLEWTLILQFRKNISFPPFSKELWIVYLKKREIQNLSWKYTCNENKKKTSIIKLCKSKSPSAYFDGSVIDTSIQVVKAKGLLLPFSGTHIGLYRIALADKWGPLCSKYETTGWKVLVILWTG